MPRFPLSVPIIKKPKTGNMAIVIFTIDMADSACLTSTIHEEQLKLAYMYMTVNRCKQAYIIYSDICIYTYIYGGVCCVYCLHVSHNCREQGHGNDERMENMLRELTECL